MNDEWRVWRVKSVFGDMFDLNHDGKMSPMENAMEFAFWTDYLMILLK